MKMDFSATMRQALRLTRAQNVMEATRVIQRALAGRSLGAPAADEPRESALFLPPPPQISVSGAADAIEPDRQPAQTAGAAQAAAKPWPSGRTQRPLREVLKLLRQVNPSGLRPGSAPLPGLRKAPTVGVPEGAAYLARTFACVVGSGTTKSMSRAAPKAARSIPTISRWERA
jgi:hypothetical protein